jgi:hypothetical protein
MEQLGKAGFPSEAFSVYNMLRYSKRTVHKSLHEKALGILVPAGLFKDAYVIVKVITYYAYGLGICFCNVFRYFYVSSLSKSN